MEAYDDLIINKQNNNSNDDDLTLNTSWHDFSDRVLAEERDKAKILTTIKTVARSRGPSLHSLADFRELERKNSGDFSIPTTENDLKNNEYVKNLFGKPLEAYPHSTDYQKVIITETGDTIDKDTISACKSIKKCIDLRNDYIKAHNIISAQRPPLQRSVTNDESRRPQPEYEIFTRPLPNADNNFIVSFNNGVFHVKQILSNDENNEELNFTTKSFVEFFHDFNFVRNVIHSGTVKSYSYKRLELLSAKFNLHILLNEERENEATKSVPHRDFYNVRKVDTHVHHSACMNQKHLLRFIKKKLRNNPDEVVVYRDGKFLTLGEVFKSLQLTAYDLSIDTLDMHANNTFHRFDKFNLKYNPAGQSRLREIFLKTENVIGGRYLAEITQELMTELEANKYQLVEWRISIYGRKPSEWASLAQWFYVNRLAHQNVRWLIQVPRLFHIYRKGGELTSFAEMINNIFAPLFEVTLNPESNIPLHYLLETVVGFDSVDDESRPEFGLLTGNPNNLPNPDEWTQPENPPYGYWLYYMYANICVLNQLRVARGMTAFEFRPHCGEAGDADHLVSAYLLAHQINHGILLRKSPGLQYLYYLSQIGIAMSPLSNNKLFLDYNKNPFPKYFRQGMNVSLSTDDPLMLHYTKDALVEEYSVATQVWKLSATDQCEIARNSVLQSGWEDDFKKHFLGEDYADICQTNVPKIRLNYRQETLQQELDAIELHSIDKSSRK